MAEPITTGIVVAGAQLLGNLIGGLFGASAQREAEQRRTEVEGRLTAAKMQQEASSQAQAAKEGTLKDLIESYRAGLGGLGGF